MSLLVCALALIVPKTICLDPGHPSEVGNGTKGKRSTELQVVWDMALEVRARLVKQGVRVVLTKSEPDQFVRNRDRARIANESKADLLLRLHCDATSGSGLTVYYPSRQGTAADGTQGPSAALLQASRLSADRFQAAIERELKGAFRVNPAKTDLATAIGAKQGALTGSIHSQVPVLLIELCVLTNPKDEDFILSARGRRILADALAKAAIAAVAN